MCIRDSPKTVQRLNYAVGDMVDVIPMPLTQDKLADISRKPVAIYAVTDRNLAKLCFDRLTACGAIQTEMCIRDSREFVENARLKREEFVNVIKMRRRY